VFGGSEFYARIEGREASVRIAETQGAVTGFNMLGSRWDHAYFERWIAERRSLDYVIQHLHEAQFDVEFGRAGPDIHPGTVPTLVVGSKGGGVAVWSARPLRDRHRARSHQPRHHGLAVGGSADRLLPRALFH
jgi:hypothetical protein